MGSRGVELKLIENKIKRQITFVKCRDNLLRKAYELSVSCDAEVGLIIFSHRGRLYEFSSNSCMTKTLERYKEFIYSEPDARKFIFQEKPLKSDWNLKDRVKAFLRFMSNLMGEDLGMLSRDDLEKLESQLESYLKKIRDPKEQSVAVFGGLSIYASLAFEEGGN